MTDLSPPSSARTGVWTPRRIVGRFAAALACVVAFVVSVAVGAVVHLGLPPARRVAAQALNRALSEAFRGTLTVEQVGRLRVSGVGGADVRLRGPGGADVVVAHGVSARIQPLALLRSLTSGDALSLDVLDVQVDDADVSLDSDETGVLELVAAVAPRAPREPSAGEGRPVHLTLPEVTIARAHVRGRPRGAPPLDVDLEGLRGSLEVRPGQVAVDVARVGLTARDTAGGFDPVGQAEVHLAVPSASGRSPALAIAFRGTAGGIPATAQAALDGDELDATLDAPRIGADAVRAHVPGFAGLPGDPPASLHAEAHGELARLAWRARLAMGESEALAEGDVAAGDPVRLSFRVDARALDLRAFAAGAPGTSIDVHADGQVDVGRDAVAGPFTLVVQGGTLAGAALPPASFDGTLRVPTSSSAPGTGGSSAARAGPEVTLHGRVLEPGAPADVSGRLRVASGVPVVDLRAKTEVARLAALRRLGWTGSGGGRAEIAATLTLSKAPTIDASVDAVADALEQGPVRIDRAVLSLRAAGPLAGPTLRGSLDAGGVVVPRFRFARAHATVDGPPSRALVTAALQGDAGPDVTARGTLDLADPSRVAAPELGLSRGDLHVLARADWVRAATGRIEVSGAVIEGAGEPLQADLRWDGGTLSVRARSKGVDLEVLGRLLEADDVVRAGRLGLDIDLALRPDRVDGDASVTLEQGGLGPLEGVGVTVHAHAEGREIAGAARVEVSGVGFLDATQVKLHVGGRGALETPTWARSSGNVRLQGEADLARLAASLPPNALPLTGLGGRVALEGFIRRGSDDARPDVTLTATTSGLTFGPRAGPDVPRDGSVVVARRPWTLSGLDAEVHVRAEADSGFAEVATSLLDAKGTLLSVDAKSATLPYDIFFSPGARALELARDVAFDAVVVVPRRALTDWPAPIRPASGSGEAEARMTIGGTLRRPRLAVEANGYGLRLEELPASERLDARCTAQYDGEAVDALVDVSSGGADLARATAHVKARAEDLWASPPSAWPWSASAGATLTRWPFASTAALGGRRTRATISGQIELTGLHEEGRAAADLELADVRVAGTKYGAGHVRASLDGQALRAQVHVGQEPGAVDADAELAATWGARLLPAIDPRGALQANLKASKFRASALAPFLPGVVDELDGEIDVDATLSRSAGGAPRFAGSASLTDGVLQLTVLGQELRQVRGRLTVAPDGAVTLEDLSASGTTGRISGSGAAQLDGLSLVSGSASLTIDQSSALPVDVQGAPVGDVFGKFEVRLVPASATRRVTSLDVTVPSLHLKLPEASTQSVQELGAPPPQDHVGVFIAPGHFERLPLSGADLRAQTGPAEEQPEGGGVSVAVHLGHDVSISRGTDLRVGLEGDLTATLQQKTELEGQLRLKSGRLDVQGKAFEIESGTITFIGDPANPLVKVTASWTASDGTKVFADYVGPLKTGKVSLRSEPPRPQNEILSLIVFGTADGSQGTPSQASAAAQAGTTVGGFAAQGLNQGIARLTGLDLTAKVDTSQGNPRPEVALQIAKSISLQIAFVLGQPPPGTNPDTTYATLDWRFFRNWSLQTTFGNLGSSIADIVWQRRY